ncbi:MAG: DUF2163 domain-containing protein [Pseudomonadota bacterium]
MREIPEELQVRLDSGATTLCRCWKIERQDGLTLGFTDHDVDVEFDGLVFAAGSGLDANAVQSSTGLSVDNCQVQGALSADAISETDIRAGKFDDAKVFHWIVDWQRPDLRVLLFGGILGEVNRVDGRHEVELRGPTEALNKPVGRIILRTCDRILGDQKCGVDLSNPSFRTAASLLGGSGGESIACQTQGSFADQWFRHGIVKWLTGANAGISRSIRNDRRLSDSHRSIDLWQAPPFPIQTGEEIELTAGCDKTSETCRAKFRNFLNFRGFPHLPGEDWVVAYPKDGEVHDGSKLR